MLLLLLRLLNVFLGLTAPSRPIWQQGPIIVAKGINVLLVLATFCWCSHVQFIVRRVRLLDFIGWHFGIPICSMYGIFTNICLKNHPNVGKYFIHGASGISYLRRPPGPDSASSSSFLRYASGDTSGITGCPEGNPGNANANSTSQRSWKHKHDHCHSWRVWIKAELQIASRFFQGNSEVWSLYCSRVSRSRHVQTLQTCSFGKWFRLKIPRIQWSTGSNGPNK